MAYNDIINQTSDAQSLIPEDVAKEIIEGAEEKSAVMTLGQKLPNLERGERRMPILSNLPDAYWVTGEAGLIQSTEAAWSDMYLYAETIATIVTIPNKVLRRANYDIWGQIKPKISEAIGKVFDQAVLVGTNAPTAFPDDIRTAAVAAGNSAAIGSFTDMYEAILGDSGIVSLLEADGYEDDGFAGAVQLKAKLRGLRTSEGALIMGESVQSKTKYEMNGNPLFIVKNGAFPTSNTWVYAGAWKQLVWAIEQDIEIKMFDTGITQDGSGNIVNNLMQQDLTAMRVMFTAGWQVANPINRLQETEASRYPFAVLTT